jgi:hypothetical protein
MTIYPQKNPKITQDEHRIFSEKMTTVARQPHTLTCLKPYHGWHVASYALSLAFPVPVFWIVYV